MPVIPVMPETMSQPILETQDLSFSYKKNPILPQEFILHEINLILKPGCFHFLLGPNGTGKTTLMRCLLGLLKPQSGRIFIKDKPLSDWSNRQRAQILSYIPQTMEQSFNFSVVDAVLMGKASQLSVFAQPSQEDREKAVTTLQKLQIEHLAGRGIKEISGGEQQLVRIARALIQDAQVLIMDEPTANLDYGNQYRLLKQIARLTDQGYTILLSTHQPQHALDFGDDVLALHKGELLLQGRPETCITRELMQTIYRQDCRFIDCSGADASLYNEAICQVENRRRKIMIPNI